MHAGDDVRERDDVRPVVAVQQEPRGHQPRMRRYGTYLRLVIVSLVVGLTVGVGSWWYFRPHEIPTTCYEWDNAGSRQTDCVFGVMSESELRSAQPTLRYQRVNRMWTSALTVSFDSPLDSHQSTLRGQPVGTGFWWSTTGQPLLTESKWLGTFTAAPVKQGEWPVNPAEWPLPVRNGVIAAGVAYLSLILIVVPARMLKHPV
jgi:hypothetical protein